MKFSLLCPSRDRHNLVNSLLASLERTISNPSNIEILFAIDNEDTATEQLLNNIINNKKYPYSIKTFKRDRSEWSNKDYYNWLVQFSTGKYLWIIGNDIIFKVKNWDIIIENKIENFLKDKPDRIACIGVKDNTPKPDKDQAISTPFPCFPIFTRESFDTIGFLLHPEIKTWGADKAIYELYKPIDRYLAINTDNTGKDVLYIVHAGYHTGENTDELTIRMGEIYTNSPTYNVPNYVISYVVPRQVSQLRGILKDKNGRHKPHCLIVTERWCDYIEEIGFSNTEHNIIGSIESSKLMTYEKIYYDYYQKSKKENCDLAVIQKCIDSKPDFVLYSRCYSNQVNCCPKWATFGIISKILKISVVTVWWEAFDNLDLYSEYTDLNIVLQSTYAQNDKNILMWTPQDDRIFTNPSPDKRDIDVSFVGSIASSNYTDRRSGIEALKNNGINVYVSGGQREHKLKIEEYANILKRSKISINFAGAGPGLFHAKGRVFESTLSGSMLLESENPETKLWFDVGKEYIEFKDNNELVEKVKYYLSKEHEKERLQIANNGHKKAITKYSSDRFWNTIVSKLRSK